MGREASFVTGELSWIIAGVGRDTMGLNYAVQEKDDGGSLIASASSRQSYRGIRRE